MRKPYINICIKEAIEEIIKLTFIFAINSSFETVANTVNKQINLPKTKKNSLKIKYSTGFVFLALLYTCAANGISTNV